MIKGKSDAIHKVATAKYCTYEAKKTTTEKENLIKFVLNFKILNCIRGLHRKRINIWASVRSLSN